eukprot:scaffold567_cov230-Alexandrium_tamarense.AAC.10
MNMITDVNGSCVSLIMEWIQQASERRGICGLGLTTSNVRCKQNCQRNVRPGDCALLYQGRALSNKELLIINQ